MEVIAVNFVSEVKESIEKLSELLNENNDWQVPTKYRIHEVFQGGRDVEYYIHNLCLDQELDELVFSDSNDKLFDDFYVLRHICVSQLIEPINIFKSADNEKFVATIILKDGIIDIDNNL